MPKTKEQKKKIIENLVDQLKNFKSLVFVDYKGLKVKEASEMKMLCKKENVKYVVAKKTLIKRALDEAGLKDVDVKNLDGNLAMVIGLEDEVAPAKITAKYSKDHKALKMLGGIMENKFIDLAQVQALSIIPSKVELLAKLVGSINAPVSGFVNVLAANLRGFVCALNAIKESKI